MRVLIVENDPIIAIDLEQIVIDRHRDAECVLVRKAQAGLAEIDASFDFAVIDADTGRTASFALADDLLMRNIAFCLMAVAKAPASCRHVPRIAKPFTAEDILEVLPAADAFENVAHTKKPRRQRQGAALSAT